MADTSSGVPKLVARRLDTIAAVTLAVLALAAFGVQALTVGPQTTQLETVLFNLLQFLLSTGFAWFGSRAVTKTEFEDSLKRFAISAYRRVADIEVMVARLQARIDSMRADRPVDECHDLNVIAAVVDDTSQVVNSSIADWADVIGAELMAIERIRYLERRKDEIESTETADPTAELRAKVQEIDKQIASLTSALPPRLRMDVARETRTPYQKRFAAQWMADRHREQDGLRLRVVAGAQYRCDRDVESVTFQEPLYLDLTAQDGIAVFDSSGLALGRALNNSPQPYREFRDTLAMCYGADRLEARFEKITTRKVNDRAKMVWYQLRIASAPGKSFGPGANDWHTEKAIKKSVDSAPA